MVSNGLRTSHSELHLVTAFNNMHASELIVEALLNGLEPLR
jgi:hypothetical protein